MSIWWRWSWRDLRARWVQVTAIAFIIAVGSGTYSGLTSTAQWRRASYDASYARLRMYDLRAELAAGSFVDADALRTVGENLRRQGVLRSASTQLVGPIQVDASSPGATVLVPGRIVGMTSPPRGASVSRLGVTAGRGLQPGDAGRPVAVLDEHFADRRGVHVGETIHVSGGRALSVVGRGLSPESFVVFNDTGAFLTDADFAIVYMTLHTAQSMLAQPGRANRLVVRVDRGVDPATARRALRHSLSTAFPGVGVTVTSRSSDRGYRLLYDDIEGDQRLYDIFAVLILLGAAFAAFNLITRIVEAQRREIGIGMALGVPSRHLAIRPLLIGVQVALLGVAMGVGVGLAVGALVLDVLRTTFPLPVWRQEFDLSTFTRGAALGVILPVLATLLPVWRALRVSPVEAIRSGAQIRGNRRALRWVQRVPLPGRSAGALPFRNVARAPRRTLMTAMGIGASIAVLIGVIGMLDSFYATIDRADHELGHTAPRRLIVTLSSFVPASSPAVTDARRSELVGSSQTELQLPARVRRPGKPGIDLLLVIGDLDSRIWHPTIRDRRPGPGVVLTQKAADDLGVRPGDRVRLHLPRRNGPVSYRFVDRSVRVIGLNPMPLRSLAWLDRSYGERLTNLAGITNVVIIEPSTGVRTSTIQRRLFPVAGVSSVQPVATLSDGLRKELDRALGILSIVEIMVLVLALLIAFNAASINADDRARENATMFAFGFPLRSVVVIEVVESLIVGVIGTAVGVLAGWLLLDWLVTELLPTTLPDLGIVTALSARTLLIAVGFGVLAVALAPLLTIRKLVRMDIPSTLRVVE
jgi:putative ABC transport system permease protein